MEHLELIHLITDYGNDAIEQSIYHALLLQKFPNTPLVFSNQNFQKGDIISPGVFIKLTYKEFPENTVHLCLLHITSRLPEKYIVAKAANQYFLAPDNGVLPIGLEYEFVEYFQLAFPDRFKDVLKEIYLPAIDRMRACNLLQEAFIPEETPKKFLMPSPALVGNTRRLSVLYNDSHGNAYLNFTKDEFVRAVGDSKFQLKIGFKQTLNKISDAYYNHNEGDMFAIFGLGDLLQICIHCGSASQYLGLKPTKMVILEVIPTI